MLQILRPLFLILALAALIAACTSGTGATTAPSVAAPSAAPSEPAASEPAASASTDTGGDATVVLADNALGSILTDAAGKTLYAFTPDTGGVPTCYDDCAAAWPPLLAEGSAAASAGAGLDASLLTTVDRTDGTKQLKYGDWPLYYFASDAAAGDTNGQGVGSKWYVVDATGALIGQ